MRPGARPTGSGAQSAARAGLTLLELLIVMGLLAVVLGVGLGSFTSLDPGRHTAVSTVVSTLRLARNEAVARRAGARVRIDPAAGSLVAEGLRIVGTWRFEEAEEGVTGFGPDADLLGGGVPLTDDGHIGSALDFTEGPPSGRFVAAVHEDPACDPAAGFSIDLALRSTGAQSVALFDFGGVAGLDLRRDGGLTGWFTQEVQGATGRPAKGGRIRAESPAGVLPAGRWVRLRLSYDRSQLTVLVDGVVVARAAAEGRAWQLEGPLVVGGAGQGLSAAVDDLVLAVVTAGDEALLPAGIRFPKDTPTQIVFRATGSLDPTIHRSPVEIPVEFEDGRIETVRVGLYGTVEG